MRQFSRAMVTFEQAHVRWLALRDTDSYTALLLAHARLTEAFSRFLYGFLAIFMATVAVAIMVEMWLR